MQEAIAGKRPISRSRERSAVHIFLNPSIDYIVLKKKESENKIFTVAVLCLL